MKRRAAFLDRDGVLIRDIDLMTDAADAKLLPGVADAVAKLQAASIVTVAVTNQSVVARGLCDVDDVVGVHREIDRQLAAAGAKPLDRYEFCPHHPHADVAAFRVDCPCRKPKPGMLLGAAHDLDLDLSASVMIGDRPTDVLAGARAGCRTVLIESEMATAPLIVGVDEDDLVEPDHRAADLATAVGWYLSL